MKGTTSGRKRLLPPPLVEAAEAIALVLLVGALLYFIARPLLAAEQARRDRVLALMEAELHRLPPAGDVSETQRISAADLGRLPTIEVVYSQVESCSEIQDHYAEVASAAGWTPSTQETWGQWVIARYQKTVPIAHLSLEIDCPSDAADIAQSGYVLGMLGT